MALSIMNYLGALRSNARYSNLEASVSNSIAEMF